MQGIKVVYSMLLEVGHRAEIIEQTHLRGVELQGAVDAGGHAGEDDPGVALKALRPSINERDDRAGIQHAIIIRKQRQLGRKKIKDGSNHSQ